MFRAFLTGLALLMPAAASAAPVTIYTPDWDGRPALRGQSLMIRAMMQGHNRARAQYGSPPLVWDAVLARDAQDYANHLARTNRFEHDRVTTRQKFQGENLWMGTRTVYEYDQMFGGWFEERLIFKPGKFPDISRNGKWSDVSHYTQIVWPTTRSVGCATASNRRDDFLVCRYWPAGNIHGVTLR